MPNHVSPTTFEGAAATLAGASAIGRTIRFVGGATKVGWFGPPQPDALVVHSSSLNRILSHDPAARLATFEAGAQLHRVQAELASYGQGLAIDPPLGTDHRATIGGVVATDDCGPLAHRYGGVGSQVVALTAALSDGTIVDRASGFDLARLFTSSAGTLGMILSVTLRLRPLPETTATAMASAPTAGSLVAAIERLTSEPLELDALDITWRNGRGGLLAQVSGGVTTRRAGIASALMEASGLQRAEVITADGHLWARQRSLQRSAHFSVLRVHAVPRLLPELLKAADKTEATLSGRAGLGVYYLQVAHPKLSVLRGMLPAGVSSVILDSPEPRGPAGRWGTPDSGELELLKALKQQLDPADCCNPRTYVGAL